MIKCPYCGQELDLKVILSSDSGQSGQTAAPDKTKWYFSTHSFVIALLCVGPLALPLIWFNPRYKLITKIIVSVVIIALTIWLYRVFKSAWDMAQEQLGGLNQGLNQQLKGLGY
jgi:hypothetical protein